MAVPSSFVAKYDSVIRKIIAVFVLLFAIPFIATITWPKERKLVWGIYAAAMLLLWLVAPRRRYPSAEKVSEGVDLTGKVVFITGPTSGIGAETARVLAKRGAQVILAARSVEKLAVTKTEIEKSLSDKDCLLKPNLQILQCDLDDLKSVEACADSFEALNLPIDILICNAGIMADPVRRTTRQGLEQQMGVNHIGHFVLVQKLIPYLQKAKQAGGAPRIVVLSSTGYMAHDEDYLFGLERVAEGSGEYMAEYEGWTAYGNAKVSNLLFAKKLHELYKGQGISAFSLHPGAINTGLQANIDIAKKIAFTLLTPFTAKSIAQGAATTVLCATKPGIEEDGGKWFNNCKATDAAEKVEKALSEHLAKTKGEPQSAQDFLWEISDQLAKRLLK